MNFIKCLGILSSTLNKSSARRILFISSADNLFMKSLHYCPVKVDN